MIPKTPIPPDQELAPGDVDRLRDFIWKVRQALYAGGPETPQLHNRMDQLWRRVRRVHHNEGRTWATLKSRYVHRNLLIPHGGSEDLRVVSLALKLARGDVSSLSAEEVQFSRVAGILDGVDISEQPPATKPSDGAFEISYSWRKAGFKGAPPSVASDVTRVALREIDINDTRVEWLLRQNDGQMMEIRRAGAALFRPLLSPGSWSPLSVSAFRSAAASGVAWRDRPYHALDIEYDEIEPGRNERWHYCTLAVDDVASPAVPDCLKDEARREARRQQVEVACTRLAVIEDRVWVQTEPPRLVIADADRLAWKCGSLTQNEPQATLLKHKSTDFILDDNNVLVSWHASLGSAVQRIYTTGSDSSPRVEAPILLPNGSEPTPSAPLEELTTLHTLASERIQVTLNDLPKSLPRFTDDRFRLNVGIKTLGSALQRGDPEACEKALTLMESCEFSTLALAINSVLEDRIAELKCVISETVEELRKALAGACPDVQPSLDETAIASAFGM